MHRHLKTAIPAAALAASFFAARANAHISLEQGGTHVSRYGDGQNFIKEAPCGVAGGARGTHVYTYAPGSTIDVSIVEYIPHPSYFRIAFDQDGDDGFKDPATILPIDPTRACPDGPGDHCGASDFYNTPEVLPNMDNLNPHLPTLADLTTPPKYTWHVTFPNVECDNCTLQVIQVMEDDAFHGPYDPTPGVGVADVYHQCIDIVLKAGAPTSNGPDGGTGTTGGGGTTGAAGSTASGATTGASGSTAGGGTNPGAGGGTGSGSSAGGAANGAAPASSSDSGGCSMTSSSGPKAPWALATVGLGLAALRRRRRNR